MLDGSQQGRARCPLTAQQPLLSDQHAGEGEGLLVIALEPLVHHLREAEGSSQHSAVGWGGGGGRGAHMAQFAVSQTTVVQVAVTFREAVQHLSGIQHSLCRPRSFPLPLPKGLVSWRLNRPPALHHGLTLV